jgi:aldehyde oxidoreductase
VLIDGVQACACLTPAGQAVGVDVTTVEGLAHDPLGRALQRAFLAHGAAQCGICTPGMLMAALDILRRDPEPARETILEGLGGVLCRCTGYQSIVTAMLDLNRFRDGDAKDLAQEDGLAQDDGVGARTIRLDGVEKVTGNALYGADIAPTDAAWLRLIRSPYARARFRLGDLDAFQAAHSGLIRVLSARDIPGENGFGIYPQIKDQPVLAHDHVRYRGEPVLALIGEREAIRSILAEAIPIAWEPLDPVLGVVVALAPDAPELHPAYPGNILIEGHVERGDAMASLAKAEYRTRGSFQTGFVEHAYIEPEAGYAIRKGDRIEVFACTQAPAMDREEVARVLGLPLAAVRIIPSACGGGFGGKLDVSLQPILAVAAWLLNRPVRMIYDRIESMASSTKRHPAIIEAEAGCDAQGHLIAYRMEGDFDTGAYASWGPTVAGRVPVHATGPYRVAHVRNHSRAIFTNAPPSGAFRGFGVPQAAIAHEALMDDLAGLAGIDRLAFRKRNAIRVGDMTATGQILKASAGLGACLDALEKPWQMLNEEATAFNREAGAIRRGIGIGCMWYGIGNTALANPSTMRLTLERDGALIFWNGAVDIGQGSTTVLTQIAASALGLPVSAFRLVVGDTDLTPDAGKTSASRQTFVSGKAAEIAALSLRAQILRLANAGLDAKLSLEDGKLIVLDAGRRVVLDPASLPAREDGAALEGIGRFDPPTAPLDAMGQGVPYATYGFAAQIAMVDVDCALGTVKVRRMIAAHDVGRAINPTLVEGQIHGGIAQGLGLALMEEYLPGRTENLHDYLIPTFGDMPDIEVILIEDREPLGPSGAKGIGEPALVPTAPAILGAIRHATGVAIRQVPALPHRIRAALATAGKAWEA